MQNPYYSKTFVTCPIFNPCKQMKQPLRLLALLGLFSLLSACTKDDIRPEDDSNLPLNERMNKFIESQMKDIYFWAEKVKNTKVSRNQEPEEFLKAIRYSEDLWSSLEENDTETRSSLDGRVKTFGYQIQFYQINDSLVGGMIQYVYKGSPAEKAGLMRGDMILANNGELLNLNNYTRILTDEQVVLKTCLLYQDTLFISKQEYALSQEVLEQDPVLLDTVLSVGNKKIGYLVYCQFFDDHSTSLPRLSQAIGRMKTATIDEFILDLRYNPGGAETAARHLGSLLAPANNVRNEDILIRKQWNPTYQRKYFSEQSLTRFDSEVLADNLDLRRIYILTGGNTASASEVVISGLRPYLSEMILIGSETYGKYVGMSQIIPPSDLQKWTFWPVTFAYTNANGESVKGGIAATYTIQEYSNFLPPFGDLRDPLLGKALELIGGNQPVIASRSLPAPAISWKPLKSATRPLLLCQ